CHYALPLFLHGKRGNIINVAGGGSTGPLDHFSCYAASKAALARFTDTLASELKGTGVTANAVHPGFVATGFNRNNGAAMTAVMLLARPFARSPRKGAETMVWLADSEEVSGMSGGYFLDKRWGMPSGPAQDSAAASRLWQVSEEQTRATAPA
ncbi:MAG: SDR family NAD(P)-dependent oxidoreductase, partial [Candidatus Dormibacteraeota bacterium]|nr:SDR family NAD(P)-dependent oxidoreductase [Candidatus Dormibacteraeota bacterium]